MVMVCSGTALNYKIEVFVLMYYMFYVTVLKRKYIYILI